MGRLPEYRPDPRYTVRHKDVVDTLPQTYREVRKSMEARIRWTALLALIFLVSMGAQHRSANFIVETPNAQFARQVAETAEKCRRELAIAWLGKEMPSWWQPCVMTVQVGPHLGAGGATTFVFDRGEVFGWRMSIQGSAERILDSVLPHEITHMVYASHFRQPLPRWADEGGATSVEHTSEKNKHRNMLNEFLRTGRGIAFNQMFAMSDYPSDIMPLYAQGYSLAEFLIQTGGRKKYVEFLGDGLKTDDWAGAVQRHYGVQDLGTLQNTWLAWVRQGSPLRQSPDATGQMLAAAGRRPRPEPNLIYRIREKLSQATPLAGLVPVQAAPNRPSTLPAVARVAPARGTVSTRDWVNPSRTVSAPTVEVAATDPRIAPSVLPASGWHVPGAAAPATGPSPTEVAHPQPLEHARPTVWE